MDVDDISNFLQGLVEMFGEADFDFSPGFSSDHGNRIYFAPGRVNLIGEHIDYNGGLVLPIAINPGIRGLFKKREDDRICLYSTTHKKPINLPLSELPGKYTPDYKWGNYPLGVIRHLLAVGVPINGFDLFYDSNLPEGSGLSSSAAIEVLTAFILRSEYGMPSSLPEIATFSQKVENEFIGVKCGIMDQFAVANCKKDHALLLDCNTLKHEHIPFELDDYALLVINSMKPRSLIKSAYNERKAESDAAVSILRAKGVLAEGQYLVDATMESVAGISDEVIRRRARHVVSEHLRVKHAANALRMGDLHTFGRLMTASHTSMKDDYEVTGQEMDTLAVTAQNIDGCLGARMTGGGFGGCAIALVRESAIPSFTDILSRRYETVTGLQCEIYTTQACDGVRAM